jgi:catechol 2,3-dioxygenase-like lactoylglutathione lyase family enzyme
MKPEKPLRGVLLRRACASDGVSSPPAFETVAGLYRCPAPQGPPSLTLFTPDLNRAVLDYVHVLGFGLHQWVSGTVASLSLEGLRLMLWGCGAPPARFESGSRVQDASVFRPATYTVRLGDVRRVHEAMHQAIARQGQTGLTGRRPVHADWLLEPGPLLQPWGAWEAHWRDGDGNLVCMTQWVQA